jgi:hypothetical protein
VVTSRLTAVNAHGAVKTRSAASGSFQILASATGVTLPGLPATPNAPPMITTAFSRVATSGSAFRARARLVSGPTATKVTSPGCSRAMSMIA